MSQSTREIDRKSSKEYLCVCLERGGGGGGGRGGGGEGGNWVRDNVRYVVKRAERRRRE